jgi:sulfotransferase family protein
MTLRINCWSGPRNVSTALMRSFSQRGDARVVDEPLYGHYLATTDAPHPARDELVDELETDARVTIAEVILGPCDRPVLFMKQMVHHLTPDLDLDFLDGCTNVLLIRDPADVIASLVQQLPHPTMRDVGLQRQVTLFEDLRARGQDPPVLDSRLLLVDPEHVLRELCARLGIAWEPAMLSWPAGRHEEDGPWGRFWYESLWRSTGFAPYRPRTTEVPDSCRALLAECRSCYEELAGFAITGPRAEAS